MLFSIICPPIILKRSILRYLFFYDVKQLNLELQYAVRFDILSCATFAISQLSRDPEDIFRTDRHDL